MNVDYNNGYAADPKQNSYKLFCKIYGYGPTPGGQWSNFYDGHRKAQDEYIEAKAIASGSVEFKQKLKELLDQYKVTYEIGCDGETEWFIDGWKFSLD